MPRPPRIQFPGANYHIVTRGDGCRNCSRISAITNGLLRDFKTELREWEFGNEDFLRRMVRLAEGGNAHRHRSTTRRINSISIQKIISATAKAHQVTEAEYAQLRSAAAGRDMAAWLCRRRSGATHRGPVPWFGLASTDSVSNLVRRAEARSKESSKWRRQATNIETNLGLKTEHKA